jgi:ubiquinone/menaquinone biosynthesis C-methylase UbiE
VSANYIKAKLNRLLFKLQNQRLVRTSLRKTWKSKKLNIGDTNKIFNCWGWETVDIINSDITINLRNNENIPIDNKCVKAVYSSHVIEHLNDDSVSFLFSEIYRLLEKDGVVRIVCPDIKKAFDAYYEKDLPFFLRHGEFLLKGIRDGKVHPDSLKLHNNLIRIFASYIETGAGPIVELNLFEEKISKMEKYEFTEWCSSLLENKKLKSNELNWGHINAFDYEKIESMLISAGFEDIHLSSATVYDGKIFNSKYFYDNEERKEWISVFVEAKK